MARADELTRARVMAEVARELRAPASRRIASRLRALEPSSQAEAELLLQAAGDFEAYANYLELEKKNRR